VNDARVDLQYGADDLTVVVRDQGVGFDPALGAQVRAAQGLGLFSIRERLRLLGGGLDIDSASGRDTRITVKVPLV
jgi:signal transduction histidine kinase